MKKRVKTITADDGDCKVKITVEFQSKEHLTGGEVDVATKKIVRGCVEGIQEVPYTDFGPENTKVKSGRK